MGDPRRIRKKYQGPRHPWNKERIEEEKQLLREYGLSNKKELWKVQSKLTNFKDNIKRLIPLSSEQSVREREQIFSRLRRLGLLGASASADDVLGLSVRSLLDRRLQTVVFKKGLARSIKQARQFIVHGHIVVGDRKITSPGYLVPVAEESLIDFRPSSSLAQEDHPERFSLDKDSASAEKAKPSKSESKDASKEESDVKADVKADDNKDDSKEDNNKDKDDNNKEDNDNKDNNKDGNEENNDDEKSSSDEGDAQ